MKDKIRKAAIFVTIIWISSVLVAAAAYYFVLRPQKNHIDELFSKLEHEIETNLVTAKANDMRAQELLDKPNCGSGGAGG